MGTPTYGLIDLIIIAIATWRMSSLLVREHGPFHVFSWFRSKTTLGGLLTCMRCATVWFAFILAELYLIAPFIVWGLAIAGAALMLSAYTGVGHIDNDPS